MNKDSFIAYLEWLENCEELTDEEFGQLMRAVFKYAKNGLIPTFSDRGMSLAWKPIRQALDRTSDKYEEKCKRNSENGKKGGRPKKTEDSGKTQKPKKANGFFENPPEREREPYPEPERDPVQLVS